MIQEELKKQEQRKELLKELQNLITYWRSKDISDEIIGKTIGKSRQLVEKIRKDKYKGKEIDTLKDYISKLKLGKK